MCRNIRTLANFAPPATREEIRASSLQFVRKLSGANRPSKANETLFDRAVEEVAAAAARLIDGWGTSAAPRGRGVEIREQLARLNRMAEEKGRDPKTISTSVFRAPPEKAVLMEYEAAGIDRAVLEIPDHSRDEILRLLIV